MSKRRIFGILALVVLILIAGAGYGIWRVLSPPEIPEFYADAIVPSGATPGQIVKIEEIESKVESARLWRMTYVSTDLDNTLAVVSALVAAPVSPAPDTGYPLIAVGHGTVGISQGCAPSIKPFAIADGDITAYEFFMGGFVDAGYAVVMSDYIGLGVRGDNSYLIGQTEGRNILDSARAMSAFPDVPVQPELLITGQSQGGHAALFAGEIAPSYAPELTILGVAVFAPAANPDAMFTGILDANIKGGIVSLPIMAADAFTRAYPDLSLDSLLTQRGRGSLNRIVEDFCLFPAILGTQLAKPSDVITTDGLSRLQPYIVQNTPSVGPFSYPVFVGQGDADQVIPLAINTEVVARMCSAGTDTTWVVYPGAGHFAIVEAAETDLLAWMSAVRAGEQPNTCA